MSKYQTLMPIKTKGSLPPLFCVHGEPLKMAMRIKADRPIYGLSHVYHSSFQETVASSIEELASQYLEDVYKVCPEGPYYLLGFSAGSMVAYEMARQLLASGKQVKYLVMIEPSLGIHEKINTNKSNAVKSYIAEVGWTPKTIAYLLYRVGKSLVSRTKTLFGRLWVSLLLALGKELPEDIRWLGYLRALGPAISAYKYSAIDCQATLVYRDMDHAGQKMINNMWAEFLGPDVEIQYVEGAIGHNDFMQDPHLSNVGKMLDTHLFAQS
jgi:thioesterase domain-containing protein